MGISKGNKLEVFCPDPLLDDNLIARTDAVLDQLSRLDSVIKNGPEGDKFFRQEVLHYVAETLRMMHT